MENKKRTPLYIILTFIVTLIISQFISAITGHTIVDPILEKFGPKNISIEPVNFPLTNNDGTFIRVNLINSGLGRIDNLNTEYNFRCQGNSTKKAEIHKKTLKKGEEDFFEFKTDLNINCSIISDPSIINFYWDKKGQCYVSSDKKTSNICSYCKLEIGVFEGFKQINNLTYWYPFTEQNLSIENKIQSGCLSYEQAKNKSELKYFPDYDIEITFLEASIGCIRGDIKKEWCIKNFPEIYS